MAPSTSPDCWSSSARANRRSKFWSSCPCAPSRAALNRNTRRVRNRTIGAGCREVRVYSQKHDEEESRRALLLAGNQASDPVAGRVFRPATTLEVILQDELDYAVAAQQVDLPEVVLGLRRVVEPFRRVADRCEPAGDVRDVGDLHAAPGVERKVDVARDVRVGERLVEQVEEADAELQLLIADSREVLEQRQVLVVPGRGADVIRRNELAVAPELRNRDAVDVQHLLAHAGVPRARIARVDGSERVASAEARPDHVRCAEVRSRDAGTSRVAGEAQTDWNTARQRRDTRYLPAVQRPLQNRIAGFRGRIGQERVPRYVQNVRPVRVQHAVRAARIVWVDRVVFVGERPDVAAVRVCHEVLQTTARLTAQGRL